jgi:hypothetical protein
MLFLGKKTTYFNTKYFRYAMFELKHTPFDLYVLRQIRN